MDALAAGHDPAVQMIDTSVVRVHQHGACIADNNHQDMGRSRGGLTSKIHAVVDSNGLPIRLALTPGETHDNRLCSALLIALLPQTMLLADRGYDADWIRELARQQGAWANIPPKRNRNDPTCFSPYLCRARNLIERFFNKIKQYRRVATRYDKLAANYLAFIKIASIRVWLRANRVHALDMATYRCIAFIAGAGCRQDCPVTKAAAFLHDPAAGSEAAASAFLAGLAVLRRINSQSQIRVPATMRVSPVHDDGMADIRCGRGGGRNALRLGRPILVGRLCAIIHRPV